MPVLGGESANNVAAAVAATVAAAVVVACAVAVACLLHASVPAVVGGVVIRCRFSPYGLCLG